MFLPENEEYTVFLPFKFRIDSKAAKQRREMNMVSHLSWGRLVFVFPVFFFCALSRSPRKARKEGNLYGRASGHSHGGKRLWPNHCKGVADW